MLVNGITRGRVAYFLTNVVCLQAGQAYFVSDGTPIKDVRLSPTTCKSINQYYLLNPLIHHPPTKVKYQHDAGRSSMLRS